METKRCMRVWVVAVAMMALLLLSATVSHAADNDLNGDGYPDIVFSNGYNGPTRNINSYAYLGAASSPYTTKAQLATQGAVGNSIADLNNDGYLDIVFSNYSNGSTNNINSYIYWGAASSPYTTKTELSTHGAIGNSVADLNNDGYLDIVFSNVIYNGSYSTNSYIYWGAASSPYTTKTELATQGAYGNSVADLNKDGHLDIVFSNSYNGSTYNLNSYIYWGAATSPYTTKTQLATQGAYGNSVADLNNDGFLDIVFSNHYSGSYNINSYIYWGAATSPYTTKTQLSTHGAVSNSVADLNGDGYLDILFSNTHDGSSRNINSYIYWGAASSPYTTKTELATQGAYGNSIADLNGDGYLDIIFSNNHDGTTGNINSYIYWGAASSPYTTKTLLVTQGAEGVSIAGSDIFGSDSDFGTVIPLWVTQGNYDMSLLTSPEYQAIATKYPLLNSGALDFTSEEIAELTALYVSGKKGQNPDPIVIDGLSWSYFADTMPGKNYGDAWFENGVSTYYFYMGSGVKGGPLGGGVPEPSSMAVSGLAMGLLCLIKRIRRKPETRD